MKPLKRLAFAAFFFFAGCVFVWWGFPKLGLPLLGVPSQGRDVASVLAHPPFTQTYMCAEHPAGQMSMLGDDLGQDCLIFNFVTRDGRSWLMPYAEDGATNEDWFGWQADVHSPCECEVVLVKANPVVNEPGRMGQSRASSITLETADGVRFVLAHLDSFSVEPGQTVRYGEMIGKVGNNGYSRSPHIHIGASHGREGLQIRWDQQFMKR